MLSSKSMSTGAKGSLTVLAKSSSPSVLTLSENSLKDLREPKSVLKLAEIPTPPLAAGEGLVRVLLSPINPSDLHMVRGRYGYQPELPASPGADAAARIQKLNKRVWTRPGSAWRHCQRQVLGSKRSYYFCVG